MERKPILPVRKSIATAIESPTSKKTKEPKPNVQQAPNPLSKSSKKKMGNMVYASAVINSLGSILSVGEALQLSDAHFNVMVRLTQVQAKNLKSSKDFEPPFCDKAVAAALVALRGFYSELAPKIDEFLKTFPEVKLPCQAKLPVVTEEASSGSTPVVTGTSDT
jgi:hypothetical protein